MSDFTRTAAQMLFQQTLPDVVRALRSNTGRSEEEAIEQYLTDTRKEVSSVTPSVKVAAIQKATYFHMLGYPATYAAFNVVEVMADTVFRHKRIGYLAACSTFSDDTDVIPLMTALLKRDLSSSNQYEVGMALYCISSVCTSDLAKDLVADVVRLLNHPRTYVRKKAVLSLYKIFLQYPESLRPTYPRLKDKLDDNSEYCDTDPAVRGAVVCVLCELARRNPANFLGLAVPFYSLLSTVQSNWTLIKIVKVFGYFAPVEPRLGKKLAEPLSNLITTTGAKSVQYECLLAVANGMGNVPALTKLTAEKLRTFVEDSDQNLKFLGLDAMSRLVRGNPKLLVGQRETILSCLDDSDTTIRCKALGLLRDLVSKKTVTSTIDAMLDRCIRKPVDEVWSNAVIQCIVETARTEDYGLIQDFEWYLGVLLEMSVMDITEYQHGALVENEIMTILLRVNGARRYGVESLSALLEEPKLLRCDRERSSQWRIYRAAAFACGEYPYWVPDKLAACTQLRSAAVARMPAEVQVACLTAIGKIAAYLHSPASRHVELRNGEEELGEAPADGTTLAAVEALLTGSEHTADGARNEEASKAGEAIGMELFTCSVFSDVQDCARLLLRLVAQAPEVSACFYEQELLPVADGAQEALEAPEGLDLDDPFCEDISALMALSGSDFSSDSDGDGSEEAEDDFDLEYRIEHQRRLERARREEVSAFYLKDQGGTAAERGSLLADGGGVARHRDAAGEVGRPSSSSSSPAPQGTGPRSQRHRPQPSAKRRHGINRDLVHPAAYVAPAGGPGRGRRAESPEVDEATKRLRGIDVTRSLGADEKLPEAVPYAAILASSGGGRSAADRSLRGNGGVAAAAAGDIGAAAEAPPVVLYEEKQLLRAVLRVERCKVKKDGRHLRCVLEVANLAVASTLHNVTVTVGDCESYPAGSVVLVGGGSEDTGDDEEGSEGAVSVSDKIKACDTVRRPVVVRLLELPESLASPLPLTLSFVKDKKQSSVQAELTFRYAYFAKRSPVEMPVSDFNSTVLAGALGDAPVAAAFLPCTKAALLVSVPAIQSALQLAPMEVFKDTATYCGSLHSRKSQPTLSHVALLLREAEEDGVKGLSIVVRVHTLQLAELLINDIVALVQSAPVS